MSQDERIAKLEAETAQLRSDLAAIGSLLQESGGQDHMFYAAILALIESHPFPCLVLPVLDRRLNTAEATLVATVHSEDYLKGAKDMQKMLTESLGIALHAASVASEAIANQQQNQSGSSLDS